MSPTLLVFIIVAVGSSLGKPRQAGNGGEVEAQGDTLTPLGVADAAKAVESEEVSLLASMTNKWRKLPSEPDSETAKSSKYESEDEPSETKSSKYESEDEQETEYESKSCTIPAYFCNPSAADMIEKVDQEVESPKDCLNFCKEKKNCKFYTFFIFRGFASCYLLKSCHEKKPVCTERETCVSGMMKCTVETPCPKLTFKRGDHSRWRCDGVNPYREDIPSHVSCHTSCPSWTNTVGKKVTVKSTCHTDGTWSDPVTYPPGPLGAFPAEVNKPDGQDMHCDSCKPLNMTYNPNEEDGAEFHCDPPIDLNNLPARIDPLAKCDLICDQMLQAEIECRTDAKWTGHPTRGFWCTKKQPAVEFWEEDFQKEEERRYEAEEGDNE